MMDWMKILAGIAMVMMLIYLWPAYKHWSANSPKAEKGDWQAVLLPIGGVVLLVLLLIMSVR
jgi:hypothetical protein